MDEQPQDSNNPKVGDKVRIRFGPHLGERAVISAVKDGRLQVKLNNGNTIHITADRLTNYSLAARRAWQTMPKRSGRPRLSNPRKKMVSMRLDIDLWQRLDEAAKLGLISNRQDAVNSWIRERLDSILGK